MRLFAVTAAFWLAFATFVGVLSLSGHCMTARWHVGPVCGQSYWSVLVTSPEILIFMFFMITDPRTVPRRRPVQYAYAIGVAYVATVLMAPVRTEFSTKVAVLAALAVLCAVRPVLEGRADQSEPTGSVAARVTRGSLAFGAAALVAAFALIVEAGSPARPARFAMGLAVSEHDRPAVPVAAGSVPAVSVTAPARDADPGLTASVANQMVVDVVADLEILRRAAQQRSRVLAATAAVGARLAAFADDEANTDALREDALRHYQLKTAAIVLVKDPAKPQSPPQVGLKATGVQLSDGTRQAFAHTFVIVAAGDHYLISDDIPS
jgi:hypothetical protein